MPSGNAEQSERWALGSPAILLPVSERVHADPQRLGEPSLREADEAPQRRNVSRRQLAAHDARPLVSAESTCEVVSGELGAFPHVLVSMNSAYSARSLSLAQRALMIRTVSS